MYKVATDSTVTKMGSGNADASRLVGNDSKSRVFPLDSCWNVVRKREEGRRRESAAVTQKSSIGTRDPKALFRQTAATYGGGKLFCFREKG